MDWGRGFRTLNWIMGTLFLLSAVLQYNDPDPLQWGALYLAAGLACFVTPKLRRPWLPAIVGVAAVIWAAWLAPSALAHFHVVDLLKTMKAGSPEIELSRELLGLVLVAGWMIVLIVRARSASVSIPSSS